MEARAFATIIKNRVNRGDILANGASFIKNGENGKGITSRWYPETLRKRILAIDQVKHRINFIEGDYRLYWQRFCIQSGWVIGDWAKIKPVLRGQTFMVSDELGMQLHDRETIGGSLTTEEKAQLEAWYTQKDEAETAMLEATQVPLPNLVMLQVQVDAAIEQLTHGVQRLSQITQENKSLREEIAKIKQQFAIPRSV